MSSPKLEVVGVGTYGCVVKGDLCSKHGPSIIGPLVSKIISNDAEIKLIKEIRNTLVKYDEEQKIVLYPFKDCTVILNRIPEICNNISSGTKLSVFTMQQGVPLEERIAEIIKLNDKTARLELFNKVRTCLSEFKRTFHDNGKKQELKEILHGDIKADNMVIMKDGSARLIDFNPYMEGATSTSIGERERMVDTLLSVANHLNLKLFNQIDEEEQITSKLTAVDVVLNATVEHAEEVQSTFMKRLIANTPHRHAAAVSPLRPGLLFGSPSPPQPSTQKRASSTGKSPSKQSVRRKL